MYVLFYKAALSTSLAGLSHTLRALSFKSFLFQYKNFEKKIPVFFFTQQFHFCLRHLTHASICYKFWRHLHVPCCQRLPTAVYKMLPRFQCQSCSVATPKEFPNIFSVALDESSSGLLHNLYCRFEKLAKCRQRSC